jgi:selenocysteine-specific elongation factor
MTAASTVQHVLIGTAGHIDHGKTRLVGRLTGVMTDRLPEEKARGISIDLGFAHWESGGYRFGVVDVPGHERFVKNMVAGATGVNLALLVVAADDSVMPQTREHLEIMDLLGVRTGVVAITKIDLVADAAGVGTEAGSFRHVEPELVELVREEIEDLVAGTFLEGKPIVAVSSETGEGIEELRDAVARAADQIEWPESREVFRLPIDRVFSLPGHGTIVTGSALCGDVHAGDTLELLPRQQAVRVRSVESHGSGIAEGGERQRTAVNLAGVKADELDRGMELATPGYLQPSNRLVVELRLLSSSPIALKDRLEVNLHLGTAEVPARVILKGRIVKPGETAFAELRTHEPIVAAYGQRFILRRTSPAITIAGGKVVDPFVPPERRIRNLPDYAESAGAANAVGRLSFLLSHEDTAEITPMRAASRTGILIANFESLCDELKSRKLLIPLGSGPRTRWIHKDRLDALSASVMRAIRAELEKHQPRRSLPRNTLATACREITGPDLLDAVFEHLLSSGALLKRGVNIGPADAQVQLTKRQRQTVDAVLAAIAAAGLMPPTEKELSAQTGLAPAELEQLLNLCREDGLLLRVGDAFHYTPENLERARSVCADHLRGHGRATMSELREAWGVTRKFSVPLSEHFDALGVTVRDGDVRTAGPRVSEPLSS